MVVNRTRLINIYKHNYTSLQGYTKLLLNGTAEKSMLDNIRKNKPKDGVVQILTVTEKQFEEMEFITGEYSSDIVSSDERLVII